MSSKGISQPDSPQRPHGPGEENRTLADDSKTLADSAAGANSTTEHRPAINVPDHELLTRIGQGSYGEVWLARNVMGTYRAVKIVYRAAFEHARPFEREFNGIQKFEPISRSHDGFVDVLQIGRTPEYFYYVMELADDVVTGQQIDPATYGPKTLRSQVQGRKALPFEQCVELGLSLTAALSHLHAHGLIHRDIKPSNIIFVNGIPKLADIGLVAEQSEAKSFVGTEGFIPPEGPGTAQADIYSLGKVLYEIATGKDRHEFPILPTLPDETISQGHLLELNAVFLKACQNDVSERYGNAGQMWRDLVLLQSGKSVAEAQKVAKRLAWLTKISLAGVLVTLLTLAALLHTRAQALREAFLRRRAEAGELLARRNAYDTDMNLAFQALNANRLGRTIDLLNHHLPAVHQSYLRGWEWRRLWDQCQGDAVKTMLPPHEDVITACAYSPDGTLLVAGGWSGSVHIWDTAHFQIVTNLQHGGRVSRIAFDSRGEFLAVLGSRKATVWRLKPMQIEDTLAIELNAEWRCRGGLAFAAKPNLLLVGQEDGKVLFRDFKARTNILSIQANRPGRQINALTCSSDGRWLASGGVDEPVRIWEVQDSTNLLGPRLELDLSGTLGAFELTFSPSGRLLAAGSGSLTGPGLIRVWDTGTGKVAHDLTNHAAWVGTIAFSKTGECFASASSDQSVRIWDAITWQQVAVFRGHWDEVWSMALAPDGTIATGGKDGQVKLWDSHAQGKARGAQTISNAPNVMFGADRRVYIDFPNQGGPRIWDSDRLREIARLSIDPKNHIVGVALTEQFAVTAHQDGSIELWDSRTGKSLGVMPAATPKSPLVLSPDGHRLAFQGTKDNVIRVFEVPGLVELPSLTCSHEQTPTEFSSNGRLLLANSRERRDVVLWDLKTGSHREFEPASYFEAYLGETAFSPDGRMIAAISGRGFVNLWDVGASRLILETRVNLNLMGLNAVTFSPDGRRLAVLANKRVVWLWDVLTRQEVGTFDAPGGALSFSADGNRLFVYDPDSPNLYVYSAPSFRQIDAKLIHSQAE